MVVARHPGSRILVEGRRESTPHLATFKKTAFPFVSTTLNSNPECKLAHDVIAKHLDVTGTSHMVAPSGCADNRPGLENMFVSADTLKKYLMETFCAAARVKNPLKFAL